ncbi:hypothetical protein ACN6MT_11430 [Neobacillus niacini]|uniref:hypothetical protein n=1 Tax=Neobacillus niacini TaxID=86668 RepID=UPI003B01CA84
MTAVVEIHYQVTSRAYQKGSFELRGRTKEQIAFEFWKQIQKNMSYHAELEKVICDNEDITEKVIKQVEEERKRKHELSDYLPF